MRHTWTLCVCTTLFTLQAQRSGGEAETPAALHTITVEHPVSTCLGPLLVACNVLCCVRMCVCGIALLASISLLTVGFPLLSFRLFHCLPVGLLCWQKGRLPDVAYQFYVQWHALVLLLFNSCRQIMTLLPVCFILCGKVSTNKPPISGKSIYQAHILGEEWKNSVPYLSTCNSWSPRSLCMHVIVIIILVPTYYVQHFVPSYRQFPCPDTLWSKGTRAQVAWLYGHGLARHIRTHASFITLPSVCLCVCLFAQGLARTSLFIQTEFLAFVSSLLIWWGANHLKSKLSE